MENKFIYLRGVKKLNNTVTCVADGQKKYYDTVYNRTCAYSSGTQVKRCIRESFVELLGKNLSKVKLNYNIDKSGVLTQGTSEDNANPSELDSLICGWMLTGGKNKKTENLSRTSALSISPMIPIHPELNSIIEEMHTFDRIDNTNTCEIVINNGNKKMSEKEMREFLSENNRTFPKFIIQKEDHINGIFKYDVAIDMRTLFCVQINGYKAQITKETEKQLIENGWVKGENEFGECLVAPKDVRELAIEALANALVDWRISTHQSFNYAPCLTDAISISYNSRKAVNGISTEEYEDRKFRTIIDDDYRDFVFVEKNVDYIANSKAVSKAFAMEDAKQKLVEMMSSYDYDKYVK